jgi:predicted phosphodiesterase
LSILRVVLFAFCFSSLAYSSTNALLISDIHYGMNNTSADGQDTGNEFLEISLNKLTELSRKADFILNLGDIPTHSLFLSPQKEEFEQKVFRGLFLANQSAKPMFYIPGNNDSLSGNYQPFEVDGKSPLTNALDWDGACVHCEGLVIDKSHMYDGGYYSSYVTPKNKNIILIALNTVQMAKRPIILPKYPNQERDAMTQLFWLEHQLKTNHAKQLIIAMHIPPGFVFNGKHFWHEMYVKRFLDILNKHHHSYDQITLLVSHTHMEEFRKIQLNDGTTIYAYSAPSVSRAHHNNPAMKLLEINNQHKVKDFTTYYTTDNHSWSNEQYHALGHSESIFPGCSKEHLAECLDALSPEQVCSSLEQGMYYSVKSPRVAYQGCINTFQVKS